MVIPRKNSGELKRAALRWALATLAGTLILWGAWGLESNFQHPYQMGGPLSFKWGPLFLAIDGVSLFFFILTALLIPICILIS